MVPKGYQPGTRGGEPKGYQPGTRGGEPKGHQHGGGPGPHRSPAPYQRGSYQPPGSTAYGAPPPAPYVRGSYPPSPQPEPSAYQAPSSYEEPGTYGVPKPRPYVASGDYGSLGHYGESGSKDDPGRHPDSGNEGDAGRHGEPEHYDEPAGFDEPGDYRPDDADSGAGIGEEQDDYSRFWKSGPGGGAHASPAVPAKAASPAPAKAVTPAPATPGDTSVYRPSPARRQLGFLAAVAVVILAVGVGAVLFLLGRHGPARHPSAAGHASSTPGHSTPGHGTPGHSTPPAPPPSSPPTLAVTGASGRLGVPGSVGALQLNPVLTGKFVGAPVRRQDANSFFIPYSDVVSGFYTTSPTAATFTASEPRLMFLVAYLAGAGNARSALHEFMTNHSFTGQQQVSAGPQGGVAACGLLPQRPAPVAHCMWADANTYADFYAWNTSTSALARTMISIRPRVELPRH